MLGRVRLHWVELGGGGGKIVPFVLNVAEGVVHIKFNQGRGVRGRVGYDCSGESSGVEFYVDTLLRE